ncbi:unnamed protein product [Leptosia nina]|uniref:Uncharacterized protein n=1 Tax=Leptosia nina TaxID=320188 RepID=A0AAV1JMG8_9NEOP
MLVRGVHGGANFDNRCQRRPRLWLQSAMPSGRRRATIVEPSAVAPGFASHRRGGTSRLVAIPGIQPYTSV